MAYEIGTADDYSDLMVKFRAFITSGAKLGAQAWQELAHTTDPGAGNRKTLEEVYLKGPGLAGADEVYVNLRRFEDTSSDFYNWGLRGAVAYESEKSFGSQNGISPQSFLTLWDTDIPYWFVANGRRFIIVAKIGTSFVACYGGLFLPYATAAEYPYPMFIGGNSRGDDNRWSLTNNYNRNFWDCHYDIAHIRAVDGQWRETGNYYNSSSRRHNSSSYGATTWPYYGFTESYIDFPITALGDAYALIPVTLYDLGNGGIVYGELDGVYFVSGHRQAAADTITIDSVDHLVVPNVYRAAKDEYAAIRLE